MPYQDIHFPANAHFGDRFAHLVDNGLITQSMSHPYGLRRPGGYGPRVAAAWDQDMYAAPDGTTATDGPLHKHFVEAPLAANDRIYVGIWHEADIFRGGNFIGANWSGVGGLYADYLDYGNLPANGVPTLKTIMLGDPAVMTANQDAELIEGLAVGMPGNPTNEDLFIYYKVDTPPAAGETFKVVFNFLNGGSNF